MVGVADAAYVEEIRLINSTPVFSTRKTSEATMTSRRAPVSGECAQFGHFAGQIRLAQV
jgi:hypothetical protein